MEFSQEFREAIEMIERGDINATDEFLRENETKLSLEELRIVAEQCISLMQRRINEYARESKRKLEKPWNPN